MSVVTPLTPSQEALQERKASTEGWFHRSLVALDMFVNVVVLRGIPDETISSHASRAALQGKTWGKILSAFLNWFQPDHGPKAQAGDIERAENLIRIERESGSPKV